MKSNLNSIDLNALKLDAKSQQEILGGALVYTSTASSTTVREGGTGMQGMQGMQGMNGMQGMDGMQGI